MNQRCPYCQSGENRRTYTEIGLVEHLKKFHRRAAYANLMAVAIRMGKKEK